MVKPAYINTGSLFLYNPIVIILVMYILAYGDIGGRALSRYGPKLRQGWPFRQIKFAKKMQIPLFGYKLKQLTLYRYRSQVHAMQARTAAEMQ